MSPKDPKFPKSSGVTPREALPYLSAAASLLTRDPEGPEVFVVNALRRVSGAAEIWSRWEPIQRGSSTRTKLTIDLRLNLVSPAVQEYLDQLRPEMTKRLSLVNVEMALRLSELAIEAPPGAPSLIWTLVHDPAWQERLRQKAR